MVRELMCLSLADYKAHAIPASAIEIVYVNKDAQIGPVGRFTGLPFQP